MTQKSKFLIGFIGPVGSGKTHLAKILARKLGAVRVTTDDVRVELRGQGKPYSSARRLAKTKVEKVLAFGKSAIADFDMVLPKRRREYEHLAKKYGARLVVIHVKTPEDLLVQRLHKKKYGPNDFFRNAREAIRVYFIRRKLHFGKSKIRVDFMINNVRSPEPQIRKIVSKLKGL